jgi:DNA processing protein
MAPTFSPGIAGVGLATWCMVRMMDDRWAWVALALAPGVGWDAVRYQRLLSLGSPAELFRASRRALAEKLGDQSAARLRDFDASGAMEGQRAAAERSEARLVTLEDAEYPVPLKQSALPPPFLFVRGALLRDDALSIAIVGSRRPTAYGLRMAERLAGDLAARGVTIVSGLARGVDTAAHRGALGARGRTVAVLGSGLDVVYPPENRGLAREASAAGAVVSQFPMGTAPLPHHFPIRNAVIAALSLGTVVVEAAERSGALITARVAGELGREVYAVPGNVSSPVSQGTNDLIRDGAKLVRDWEDVVVELAPVWQAAIRQLPAVEPAAVAEGGRVLPLVGEEPVAIDLVIERSGLPASEVAASLTDLELRGLVRKLPGQRYVRS